MSLSGSLQLFLVFHKCVIIVENKDEFYTKAL